MRKHRGGLIGDMLVDSQAITLKQQKQLLEIQSKEVAAFKLLQPDTPVPFRLTYGQLALKENFIDTDGLELIAALQAYDRLSMAFEVFNKMGLDTEQLADYRTIDKLLVDLTNPPLEPWIDRAPTQTKQLQARTSLFKMLIATIELDRTLAFTPDTFDALCATLRLIELEKKQLVEAFKESGLFVTAQIIQNEPLPSSYYHSKHTFSEQIALKALAHGVEHALTSLEKRSLLSEQVVDNALKWVALRKQQSLPDVRAVIPAMDMTISPIHLSANLLPQFQAKAQKNILYNTMEIDGSTRYQTPSELPTFKSSQVKSSLY